MDGARELDSPEGRGKELHHQQSSEGLLCVRDPERPLPHPTAPPRTQAWKQNVEEGVFSLQLEGFRVEKKNGLDYWVLSLSRSAGVRPEAGRGI